MTYAEFAVEMRRRDREAERAVFGTEGSESEVLGYFVARMVTLAGPGWRESEAIIDETEAAWWRQAYDLYEADRARPEAEQSDMQELFDRVSV